ncbi:MAG: Gfo/Idh/MocA family oxidoreductase, partial [Nitrosospira sp.]|nr:Gfo/Idh/MocA family oxidoreductase [Nitrosospira sp.]
MIRLAVVGLGKMGLSHYAIIATHPLVKIQAICDSTGYVLDVLKKYTGVATYSDFDAMLREVDLDAVIIATPSSMHAGMVRAALQKNLHVFCEKPFCLDTEEGRELADLANSKALVNQVGYHNRFVGAFGEVKRLLDLGAIGKVTHILAEAYGPVVLKTKGTTWRTQRHTGGGCLYDYGAHPLDLVNWSDEAVRKMTTKINIWGTQGRIYADRQECRTYLRDTAQFPPNYHQGWNVRYTTELTEPVWFYLRGEEYSAQLDYFVRCIAENRAA